jgi:hypothetical protein
MSKKGNGYDWEQDAIRSYVEAIEQMRQRYIRTRREGESANDWLKRTGNDDQETD